ncbi:endonuclease [Desulforhopalus vacuolatus]|uniref:endonuclease n=1 Tax=Desulforhopalus vacuolatus TaxID=40414 RepID=UPI00196641F7|nr:endonuclease [Desulforhopalus vacuolatus]MBM9520804.1 endonuclease [Desulforhopalus vacuolatus]
MLSIDTRISCIFVFVLLFSSSFTFAGQQRDGNTSNQSFSKAKRILLQTVYRDYHKTFYCDCGFEGKKIIYNNGYVPYRNNKRAQRLEWEHVVPAQAFGHSFSSWRDGDERCVTRKGKSFKGRNCARKASTEFRYMEADMHNLMPSVGEINGLRSNYSFAMISGESRRFGTCDMEIKDRKAEPPLNIRGDIARTYRYMDAAYPGHGIISKKNRKLFAAWDKEDPVDIWECERERRVAGIQGNRNRFVAEMCLVP